jgi:hypothetical protein
LFDDTEIDFLEQYSFPIYGMLEELRDPDTTNDGREAIKKCFISFIRRWWILGGVNNI